MSNNRAKVGAYHPSEETFNKPKPQDEPSEDKDNNLSYTAMIAQAIMVTPSKRSTLSEIYEYMSKTFEILKKRGSGWRNCVRHTLSLNECFLKLHRPENGRSCNWTVHPAYFEAFSKGDYRKRRANRKKTRAVPWLDDRAMSYNQSLGMQYIREPDMRLRDDLSRVPGNEPVTSWQGYNHVQTLKSEPYHNVPTFPYDNRMSSLSQPTTNNTPFPTNTMHAYQHPENQYTPIPTHNEANLEHTSRYPRPKDNRSYANHMEYMQDTPQTQYTLDPNCLASSTFGARSYRQDFF